MYGCGPHAWEQPLHAISTGGMLVLGLSHHRVRQLRVFTCSGSGRASQIAQQCSEWALCCAGEPATEPTTFIPPAFNSMAVFTVQPGRSFHSIQQVYATDKPRLSISGWFHGLTPPPGAENASIAQLKASPADSTTAHGSDTGKSATPIAMVAGASAAEIDTMGGDTPCHAAAAEAPPQGNGVVGKKRAEPDGNHDDNDGIDRGMASAGKSFAGSAGGEAVARYDKGFVPLQHAVASAGAKLSAAEKRLLGEWINPLYLERGSMGSMVAQWEKASCVQLHKFLKPDVAAQV